MNRNKSRNAKSATRRSRTNTHISKDDSSRLNDLDMEESFTDNQRENLQEFQNREFCINENFELKPDHEKLPLWICSDGTIYLEAFSPLQKEATEFLIAIAEPVSRPLHIHQYKLTSTSLYAAASVELKKDDILKILHKFSKNKVVPQQIEEMIDQHTKSYGKAKLILQQNKYFIEAETHIMQELLRIPLIKEAYEKAKEVDRQKILSNQQAQDQSQSLGLGKLNKMNTYALDQQYAALQEQRTQQNLLQQSQMNNPFSGQQPQGLKLNPNINQNLQKITKDPKQDVKRFQELYQEHKILFDIDKSDDDEVQEILHFENQEEEAKQGQQILIKNNSNELMSCNNILGLSIEEQEKLKNKKIRIRIEPDSLNALKEQANKRNYPLIQEYDFNRDPKNEDLKIELKPNTIVRDYQEQALSKMFSNGRARSGIIVLPCGAGKTLTGITAACTIKKSTMVVCTTQVSSEQWKREFLKWSHINPNDVIIFHSKTMNKMKEQKQLSFLWNQTEEQNEKKTLVLICTYYMLSYSQQRADQAQLMMNFIQKHDWGLVLLDEVQQVAANSFSKITEKVKAHCKLGLTATLVREDNKICNLHYLIGPKLYEANWIDLVSRGFLARVQCIEVWCEMTADFYKEYYTCRNRGRLKEALFFNNPTKYQAVHYLKKMHEERGDKIIIFCDHIFSLKEYAHQLCIPFISGEVSNLERMNIISQFRDGNEINTIIFSQVGDTSIDIPNANVIIEVGSPSGARCKETQRLGRILRPKTSSEKQAFQNQHEFNAYFYSLISLDTDEVKFAKRRQQYLVDQGFHFDIIQEMPFVKNQAERQGLILSQKDKQIDFMGKILRNKDSRDMGYEDEKNLEKDEDKKALDDEIQKENPNVGIDDAIMQGFTGGNEYID